MKFSYSAEAVEDLIRLRAFIVEKKPEAASRTAIELVKRIEALKQFPDMGREVSLAPVPSSIRDMVFGDYIVRYAPIDEVVMILRIWHHYELR